MTAIVSYQPNSLAELDAFCQRICKTELVPQAYRGKPEAASVAIIAGNEWGIPPLASLRSIAVINGMPSLYGDALPGLAMAKGLIKRMREWIEGEGEHMTAFCGVERPDGSVVQQQFSVDDAKLAKLWGKAGPWQAYPQRMLQVRARSWAIRDAAPHMYFGMSVEEARDLERQSAPPPRDITPPRAADDHRPASPREEVDAAMADEPSLLDDLPEARDPDPLRLAGLSRKDARARLEIAIEEAHATEADILLDTYREKIQALNHDAWAHLSALVAAKIEGGFEGQ